ncbi:hypothetical protein [Streptomyces canus]
MGGTDVTTLLPVINQAELMGVERQLPYGVGRRASMAFRHGTVAPASPRSWKGRRTTGTRSWPTMNARPTTACCPVSPAPCRTAWSWTSRVGEPYRTKPNQLARSLMLSTGGTTNVPHRFVARGAVEREDDPADTRSTWLS